jgi:hypothetical protein
VAYYVERHSFVAHADMKAMTDTLPNFNRPLYRGGRNEDIRSKTQAEAVHKRFREEMRDERFSPKHPDANTGPEPRRLVERGRNQHEQSEQQGVSFHRKLPASRLGGGLKHPHVTDRPGVRGSADCDRAGETASRIFPPWYSYWSALSATPGTPNERNCAHRFAERYSNFCQMTRGL